MTTVEPRARGGKSRIDLGDRVERRGVRERTAKVASLDGDTIPCIQNGPATIRHTVRVADIQADVAFDVDAGTRAVACAEGEDLVGRRRGIETGTVDANAPDQDVARFVDQERAIVLPVVRLVPKMRGIGVDMGSILVHDEGESTLGWHGDGVAEHMDVLLAIDDDLGAGKFLPASQVDDKSVFEGRCDRRSIRCDARIESRWRRGRRIAGANQRVRARGHAHQ